MKKNMGSTDRWIRIVIGLVVIALGVFYQNWWGVLGVIPLLTAIILWCPLYVPFGIRTCKETTEKKESA